MISSLPELHVVSRASGGNHAANPVEVATHSLAQYREQVRKDLLGQPQPYKRIKKQSLASLLAAPVEVHPNSAKYTDMEADWNFALKGALEQPETAARFTKGIKPFALTDYRSELDSIKSDEPPEFTPGSGAEEMCHPILKRLELFKRTVEHELLKEPGHFELVSCVMKEYEVAIRSLKGLLLRRTDPNGLKEALFHVTTEYREALQAQDSLNSRLQALEAEVMDLTHANSRLKEQLQQREARLDFLSRSLQEYAFKIFPDNQFPLQWSEECTQDQCVQAGACQCQAQPGFLEAFMGHVHSELKRLADICEKQALDVKQYGSECEKAQKDANDAVRAQTIMQYLMEEKDLQSCELKGTINSLCSRLSRIQVVRDQVQLAQNKVSILEHKVKIMESQESHAMGLMVHFLSRRGYKDAPEPPPPRNETLEAAGTDESVPEIMRGTGKLKNRMMGRDEVNRILEDIWKDKKRWESVKQTKIEFGPHYVGMLKQKFGVVGNTTGVGSLLILEHVYSLIDACSIFGQSDFELFMYARLLKSEIPDEIFPDMKKKISDFEAMLKKMNQSIPRVPMKVPKKSKAAWDYAPVPLIYEVIEQIWDAKSEHRLKQLHFAVMLFFNDGDVSTEEPRGYMEWVRLTDLLDKSGKFIETLKCQQLEEYDEFVEEIRQAILVGHPTLGPRDMISLLDIYHKFIEIDPRQPKSLVKRMILMAAGIVTPNMKKSMKFENEYQDLDELDREIEFHQFFASFRRLCYMTKCTKI